MLVPPLFLLAAAAISWETLRWLTFSVAYVPFLAGLGLFGLFKGLFFSGLLIGAVAARSPFLLWPKLLAAALVPMVDVVLLRWSFGGRLVERAAAFLMDGRALFLLDNLAPAAASLLAALLVPQSLLRLVLRRRRDGSSAAP